MRLLRYYAVRICRRRVSYAGLLSYIYTDLKKDDPRVTAVHGWLRQNLTLEENPGMGADGLFNYYHMMAKALSAFGEETITVADGTEVNWAADLALKMINLQQADGSWVKHERTLVGERHGARHLLRRTNAGNPALAGLSEDITRLRHQDFDPSTEAVHRLLAPVGHLLEIVRRFGLGQARLQLQRQPE